MYRDPFASECVFVCVCLCCQSALSLPAASSLIYDRDFHLVSLPLQYQQVVVEGMESPADTFRIASPS